MGKPLDRLAIKGFKSIRNLENFELKNLNILIGANGSGKSNFIDFFRMMRAMMELPLPYLTNASLQAFINDGGGSDDFLFNGPKVTKQIEVETFFGANGYRFKLAPTVNENFIINDEQSLFGTDSNDWRRLGGGYSKPALLREKDKMGAWGGRSVASHIYEAISSWKVYHFHDTSKLAPMRRSETIDDYEYLRFDGANIAPFLYSLKNSRIVRNRKAYDEIIDTIRLVAPFFEDFVIQPDSNDKVRLHWRQRGSDYPLKAHQLSDGTIRFICMISALLQPDSPSTIIIDEPELGLHPYAISILAELIQSASESMQIIISTQSPALVDCFRPENIVVVNRKDGASTFERLKENELSLWMEDYSLGDLWRKNVIAGGPIYE